MLGAIESFYDRTCRGNAVRVSFGSGSRVPGGLVYPQSFGCNVEIHPKRTAVIRAEVVVAAYRSKDQRKVRVPRNIAARQRVRIADVGIAAVGVT